MKKPLISVIITSYNNAETLPRTLEAIAKQTLKDIEVICVDDGSKDDSAKVIQGFAQKDKRFQAIINTKNSGPGPSVARNMALEKVSAPYVMFCDADDYYEPTACEVMYKAVDENKVDIAISEINVVYQAHREMRVSDDYYYSLKYQGKQTVNDVLVLNTDSAPTNKIFRKSLLDKYQIRFPDGLRYEDAYFCAAYFCVCKTAYYVNERLYNYIRHKNSIMSQTWSSKQGVDPAIDHLVIAFCLYDFLEKHNLLEVYCQLYWSLFYSFLRFAIMNSKSREGRKKVRARAKDFIAGHQSCFLQAPIGIREDIQRLCSSKFHLDIVGLKRFVIKLMPTYRLEVSNIHRMQALKNKNQELRKRLNKIQKA